MNNNSKQVFLWIDCEMTGLNPNIDRLLEVAVILTDASLVPIIEKSWVIGCEESILAEMDPWCRVTHKKSGLYDLSMASLMTIKDVEDLLMQILLAYTTKKMTYFAGNSVYFDYLFLRSAMPKIIEWCHYRIIDVSSIKTLYEAWRVDGLQLFQKKNTHRALDDIKESIQELMFYRDNFFLQW